MNQVTIATRGWIQQYYCSSMEWEDEDNVVHQTRNVRLTAVSGVRRAADRNERWLYTQLMYLKWKFDPARNVPSGLETGDGEAKMKERKEHLYWAQLYQHIEVLLEKCNFRYIQLSRLFSDLKV